MIAWICRMLQLVTLKEHEECQRLKAAACAALELSKIESHEVLAKLQLEKIKVTQDFTTELANLWKLLKSQEQAAINATEHLVALSSGIDRVHASDRSPEILEHVRAKAFIQQITSK